MKNMKRSVGALALLACLASASVLAQEPVARTAPQEADGKAKATSKAPLKTPPKAPPRRRAVPQTIFGMPPAPSVVTDHYRPAMPPGGALPGPRAPVLVNSCDGGGCFDTNGVRYNSGPGNTATSPDGKICTRNGPVMQCF